MLSMAGSISVMRVPMLGISRVKIPRGRQQRQGADFFRQAQRRCQSQQPTHAIPRQHHLPWHRGQSALQPPGNVVGERKAPLHLARPAPIQQIGMRAIGSEPAQHGAALHQVQNIGAVDQAGHEQHSGAFAAIIQQPGLSLLPHRRRVGHLARIGGRAIRRDAFDQRAVGLQRLFKACLEPCQIRELRRVRGQRVRGPYIRPDVAPVQRCGG